MADKAYTNGKKLLWGDYFEYTPTGASLARKQGKYTTNGAIYGKAYDSSKSDFTYENFYAVGFNVSWFV